MKDLMAERNIQEGERQLESPVEQRKIQLRVKKRQFYNLKFVWTTGANFYWLRPKK